MVNPAVLDGPSTSSKWSTFVVNGETLALPIADVREVMKTQALTRVPLAPAHVCGLLNLRGQIVYAADVRAMFGWPTTEGRSKLIVLKWRGRSLALLVDDIGDVLELNDAGWRPPPDTLHGPLRPFAFGIFPVEDRMVLGLRTSAIAADIGDEDEAGR
jgi:purine-binding chemotaxis protein CheW